MEILLVVIFVFGYLAITIEHTLKVDKLIPALAMMGLLWAVVALGKMPVFEINHQLKELEEGPLEGILLHHLGKTAEILIFLLGAMTIVEITDYFNGFASIRAIISSNKKKTLLWVISSLAFILSAIIDNLTATIILITILKKLLPERNDRLWFAGMIVIAANAGGAWSPIGDVTTTMLWIGGKVTTAKLVTWLLLPSLVCMAVPLVIAGFLPAFRGEIKRPEGDEAGRKTNLPMLILGLGAIVFVPIFKVVTHLPPYIGMMFSLAVVAAVAEIMSNRRFTMADAVTDDADSGHGGPVTRALTRIELPSIFFFLGILMAVAALESTGQLFHLATWLNTSIPNENVVVMLIGAGSAVIDNVPLVAASIGMFSQDVDAPLWHFIAYAAGTGGSMLIIGSAAGVVAMGMERINFIWYVKKIALLAMAGYLAGAFTFLGLAAIGYIR
jgi:Na+/H+ antiporter NhaD/arsenite permease-like protein